MFIRTALAALTACVTGLAMAPQSPSGVVINEINYDDSGSDDFEFVEIYNGSGAAVDLSNWTLNGIDGTTSGNGLVTFAPGTILPPGGFRVVGDPGVPNVSDPLTGLSLENGADGVFLLDGNGVYQDGVCWETADWTNALPTWLEGDGLWGAIQGVERPTGTLVHAFGRGVDGLDTDDNGCDFRPMPATPGELNILGMTTALPYTNNFDDPVTSIVASDFIYSFVPGNTQDPSAIQGAIISGIPQPTFAIQASPQGGNVSVWHDPTGGGNANWLRNFSQSDYVFEAYVYLTGPNPNMDVDDGTQWSIGVRGHSDSFGEFNDLGGFVTGGTSFGGVSCTSQQPGHTGIAWTCQRTGSTCDLYLVDYNNGGGDPTVLGGPIQIATGANDGWQRIRIRASGNDITANFGGSYGCDDGTQIVAQTNTTCANGVYVTFRECVTDNNNILPLIMDRVTVANVTNAATQVVGTGSPTVLGVPTIAASGSPTLGDASFAVIGSNLLGAPFSGCIFDVGAPLPGLPIPGAPPTAALYANPTLVFVVPGGSSQVSFPLALPCNPALDGTQLVAQIFDWDATQQFSLPVGLSAGLVMTLGY